MSDTATISDDIRDTAKHIAEQPWLTRAERDRMAEQIAKAIASIEQVTQRTAANAEESCASAADLTEQAQRLSLIVDDLKHMVGEAA